VVFKVTSITGAKGRLLNETGEEVKVGDEVKRGDSLFTYEPNTVGNHDVRIEISDEDGDTKESVRARVHVKPKTSRFRMELKEMDGKNRIFPYQEVNLHLELLPVDEDASKLEYTIKSLSVLKGRLIIKGGEELKEGMKLEFRGHDLVFVPSGELGVGSVKMTIENDENGTGSGGVAFAINPVGFDLTSSMSIVESSAGEQAEMNVCIPRVGNDIDREVFKVATVEFSDGIQRKLAGAEGIDLVGSKLTPGLKYAFSLPLKKVEDGARMTVRLEGAGKVHEKVVDFSDMHKQALARKGKEALASINGSVSKANDLLLLRVEESSYEKVVIGQEALKKDILLAEENVLKFEELGLEKHGLGDLKEAQQKLIRSLAKVEKHLKNINDKKLSLKEKEGLTQIKQSLSKASDLLLLKVEGSNYEKIEEGQAVLRKDIVDTEKIISNFEGLGLDGHELAALKEAQDELTGQLAKVEEHLKKIHDKKFEFSAQLAAPKRSVFSYQKAEVNLEVASPEKGATYTVKHMSPLKGKLRFSDGGEVKPGAKVSTGKRKLVFEPSGEAGRETLEMVLESDKGTSSKAEIDLEVKPVEFDLKGAFSLLNLEKGELKLWVPTTSSDLDKEGFKVVGFEFSDEVERTLTPSSSAKLTPGNEFKFLVDNQKIEDGVKLMVTVEVAGEVYEKEIEFGALYRKALLVRQSDVLGEIRSTASQGRDLLLKNRVEHYEEVVSGQEKLQKKLAEMVAKVKKLEALGVEGDALAALREAISEVEEKVESVEELIQEIAKKKFAFDAKLQAERHETFTHLPVPLKLILTSLEPATRRLNHRIKEIALTRGRLQTTIGAGLVEGQKVNFGENEWLFVPSEEGQAKVKVVIENEKGAEETAEVVITVKPIEFSVHVGTFDSKQKEGFGKLDVSIETDKQLEKESFKVVRWAFKKDDRDRGTERVGASEAFTKFKENMCLLVAGGREEARIDSELEKLEEEEEAREEEQTKSTEKLNEFQRKSIGYTRELDGMGVKMLEHRGARERPSASALTIGTKYGSLEKEKALEAQRIEKSIEKEKLDKAALVQQQQIARDKKIFDKEMRKISDRKEILTGKKQVWQDLKQVRDKRFSEEARPELLNARMESKGSYDLSGKDITTLFLKLNSASIPSVLVLTVEGPGGVLEEVEVSVREGGEERVVAKVDQAIKNLDELAKEMDGKSRGDSNGAKFHELTTYIESIEETIKTALKPLRDSHGEDWWTNPRFMEIKNSKELTDSVLRTMEKLKKLEEKKKSSYDAMRSFNLGIEFSLPKEERVWTEDYLDMELSLEDVDSSMEDKVWKVLSWECSDKAVIIAGDKGKILSEILLETDGVNKLHVKIPNVAYGQRPELKIRVGAFDGEELVMESWISTNLDLQVKMLFEDNVSRVVGRVKALNELIKSKFESRDPADHRFDALAGLKMEADALMMFYEVKEKETHEQFSGLGIRELAPRLSREVAQKALEYVNVEIPKLRANIELLKEKKGFSQGPMTKVEELSNVEIPDADENLMIHKLASRAGISKKTFAANVKATDDVNAVNTAGYTALHLLLKSELPLKEKKERLEALVEAGVDLNKKTKDGKEPMWWLEDHAELIAAAFKEGSGLKPELSGEHIMLRAVSRGQIDIVKALLKINKNWASIDFSFGREKEYKGVEGRWWTPLHVAAVYNRLDIAEVLVDADANKDMTNSYSISGRFSNESCVPAQLAVVCGSREVYRAIGGTCLPGW
jgi:hypothetical protein